MGADKPFECVGEVGEARAALRALAADPAWAGDALVARLAPAAGGPDAGAVGPWLTEAGPHGIPERHLRAARALLGPRG
jgi:UDP-N-acetyl-alpha-D-muramoyl-L-alanyl-L-glutamate epimerase